MRSHVGGIAVEITRPESAKFHRPLLLLHGLWADTWIWDPFAGYLAHRGWESWAPSLVGLDATAAAEALDPIVRALPNVPIVVSHDVGVLLAAACAARLGVPALVAIAPVLSPAEVNSARGIFAWPQFWRARFGGSRVSPPRGAGAHAFIGAANSVGEQLRADSGAKFRAIASGRARLPAGLTLPGLVLGGARDAIVPESVPHALAARFDWTARVYPGRGHFLIVEPGWEIVADDVHRWIVRTLGADLLAFLENEEDPL